MIIFSKIISNLKSLIEIIVCIACVIVLFSKCNTKNNSFEQGIKDGIVSYSKTLPQRIDEITILDSLSMPSDKVLNYYYTVGISKEEANYTSIEDNVNSAILTNIKTSAELEPLRSLGYTWHYLYYDRNGNLFHDYIVSPDMY